MLATDETRSRPQPKTEVPIPPYTYKCVDRSPLVGPFCRYVVKWFAMGVPGAVPANYLTLGSSACMWVMLAAAFSADDLVVLAPWFAVLMFGYMIYDHADGMHARRTRTGSPLGEYLDHFTDVFHGAIALVAMFMLAGREGTTLCVVALWAVLLAGAATMAEERERGELFFGFVGPLEGMLLALAFFGSWCVPGASAWWHAGLVEGFTIFECAMAFGAVGSVLTAVACVRRIGRLPSGLAAYALAGALLCARGVYFDVTWWETALLMTLHGADFTGRVIAGHLRGTKRPAPDWIAPVALVACSAAGLPAMLCAAVASVYLIGRVAWSTTNVFRVFGRHWRWFNAPAA